MSQKGAIDQVVEYRTGRHAQHLARERKQEALATLKNLNVEMENGCSATGLEVFAMTVLDSKDLQSALEDAGNRIIRVALTNKASHVKGEEIFINWEATALEAYAFLRGRP